MKIITLFMILILTLSAIPLTLAQERDAAIDPSRLENEATRLNQDQVRQRAEDLQEQARMKEDELQEKKILDEQQARNRAQELKDQVQLKKDAAAELAKMRDQKAKAQDLKEKAQMKKDELREGEATRAAAGKQKAQELQEMAQMKKDAAKEKAAFEKNDAEKRSAQLKQMRKLVDDAKSEFDKESSERMKEHAKQVQERLKERRDLEKERVKDFRDRVHADAKNRKEAAHTFAKEQHQKLQELKEDPELREFAKERAFKVRVIRSELRERHHEENKEAKEKLREHRAVAKTHRDALKERKAEFDACEENCDEAEEELKTEAREYLGNSAQAILSALEQFKARIESSEHLSEERAAELLATLDEKITSVQEAEASITDESSRKELREAAKIINSNWKDIKKHLHNVKRRLSQGKVGGVVVQSEHVQLRLQNAIAILESNGVDTSGIDSLSQIFEALVATAKSEHTSAREAIDDEQAQEHLDSAKEAMKEARSALQDILKEMRNLRALDVLAAASDEEVEVVEDEAAIGGVPVADEAAIGGVPVADEAAIGGVPVADEAAIGGVPVADEAAIINPDSMDEGEGELSAIDPSAEEATT